MFLVVGLLDASPPLLKVFKKSIPMRRAEITNYYTTNFTATLRNNYLINIANN